MRNYKMIVQYEGTRYQGWQKQDSTDNTIQGKLETLLSKMCETRIEVVGSGRTDAGVHAKGQVINVHMNIKKTPAEIMDYMNTYLPEDIGIISISEVPERFHSRLNAKKKTYCYQIINSKVPHVFDRRYAYTYEEYLDVEAMKEAAKYLLGTHDFAAFTSTKKSKKSSERTIDKIDIEKQDDMIRFTFTGDGFLFHMIRILMGTLLEVGSGKKKPEEMENIVKYKKREMAGPLVPAQGLTLMEVNY